MNPFSFYWHQNQLIYRFQSKLLCFRTSLKSSIKLSKNELFKFVEISIEYKAVISEESTKTYPNLFICNSTFRT